MAPGIGFYGGDTGLNRVYPGDGGHAGFVFGTYGEGGRGVGPTSGESDGQAGNSGIIVVYEYIV